jgi:hypothetical protein
METHFSLKGQRTGKTQRTEHCTGSGRRRIREIANPDQKNLGRSDPLQRRTIAVAKARVNHEKILLNVRKDRKKSEQRKSAHGAGNASSGRV